MLEDIGEAIIDLPTFIADEEKENKSALVRFRVTQNEKKDVESKAKAKGFKSISEYVRHLALR